MNVCVKCGLEKWCDVHYNIVRKQEGTKEKQEPSKRTLSQAG
jgi:hypothetical protein